MKMHRMIARLWGVAGLIAILITIGCGPAEAQSVREIRSVQSRLAELGYDPGPADGLSGSQTRDAIAAFQSDMGLERTGEITVSLMSVLGANPNAPRPLEEIQARLVDIIGAKWDEQAGPDAPSIWAPPPEDVRPQFSEYPASNGSTPLVERIDLDSNPDAILIEDDLHAAVGQPPDFAGRFRIVLVNCGTTCQGAIAVNAGSGRVITGPTAEFGMDYQPDSRLLIANPVDTVVSAFADKDIPAWAGTRWFVFDGYDFHALTVGDDSVEPDATAGQ